MPHPPYARTRVGLVIAGALVGGVLLVLAALTLAGFVIVNTI